MLLTTFTAALVKILAITAPQIAKEVSEIGVPTLVDLVSAGLGIIVTVASGIGLWYRGRSRVAPLTLTQKSADTQISAPTPPEKTV